MISADSGGSRLLAKSRPISCLFVRCRRPKSMRKLDGGRGRISLWIRHWLQTPISVQTIGINDLLVKQTLL